MTVSVSTAWLCQVGELIKRSGTITTDIQFISFLSWSLRKPQWQYKIYLLYYTCCKGSSLNCLS